MFLDIHAHIVPDDRFDYQEDRFIITGEGHTLAPYSEAIDKNAKVVIRTTKERLEAKKQGKETQTHTHDNRDH